MKLKTYLIFIFACIFISPLSYAEKKTNKSLSAKVRGLVKVEGWRGENARLLQKMLNENGIKSTSYDSKKKPIAVFDWDNTVIKNDVGDATLYWIVSKGLLRKPTSWRATSPYLTDEAVQTLEKNCGDLPDPLPTNTNSNCADTILFIYVDGKLSNSKDAWNGTHNPDVMEPSYAWGVQLAAGYTASDISKFATDAIKYNLENPVGAKQKIGSKEYTAYMRIYPEIHDLITALQSNEFDVWVSSASMQYIVEPFAAMVGVSKNRVIGVRPVLDKQRKITTLFQSCSNVSNDAAFINYRLGKRCWINKVIFHQSDKSKLVKTPSPIDFAAGDSDTDFFFVKDARILRLAINRNKAELMCHAYANMDGKWLVNPMFIDPKPQKAGDYSCAKFGLSDQKDLVF